MWCGYIYQTSFDICPIIVMEIQQLFSFRFFRPKAISKGSHTFDLCGKSVLIIPTNIFVLTFYSCSATTIRCSFRLRTDARDRVADVDESCSGSFHAISDDWRRKLHDIFHAT